MFLTTTIKDDHKCEIQYKKKIRIMLLKGIFNSYICKIPTPIDNSMPRNLIKSLVKRSFATLEIVV